MRRCLNISIEENNPTDVLRWYRAYADEKPSYCADHLLNRVAECLSAEYPDWSIAIWKRIAEMHINRVQPSAYEDAAPYLKRIKKTLSVNKKEADWKQYYQRLCLTNRRRPRCMEVLRRIDNMEKPLL